MKTPQFIVNALNSVGYRKLERRNDLLTRQIKILATEVQAATDPTTNTDPSVNQSYIGTPTAFNSYAKQVIELGRMYDNIANWGCMMAKNVIDVRTAFSVGNGVMVEKNESFKGSAEKEIAWCKEFMHFNDLDNEMPLEYAKEAEIEGKVLFRMLLDEDAKNIRVAHTPWRTYDYTIYTPDFDFNHYIRARFTGVGSVSGQSVSFDLAEPLFVYKRFGGTASKVNETPPKTAFVIREMRDLDKAIVDWRKINRLFSAPTPVFVCPDSKTAQIMQQWVDNKNYRAGKELILGGKDVDFKLVGWKGDGFTTLQAETETLVKTVSGTTGVPVHFLGYPELLSNRDTAENLIELIALSTDKERHTWASAYTELFGKAMVIYNTVYGTKLNPDAVVAEIEETKLAEAEEEELENAPVSNGNSSSNEPE